MAGWYYHKYPVLELDKKKQGKYSFWIKQPPKLNYSLLCQRLPSSENGFPCLICVSNVMMCVVCVSVYSYSTWARSWRYNYLSRWALICLAWCLTHSNYSTNGSCDDDEATRDHLKCTFFFSLIHGPIFQTANKTLRVDIFFVLSEKLWYSIILLIQWNRIKEGNGKKKNIGILLNNEIPYKVGLSVASQQ